MDGYTLYARGPQDEFFVDYKNNIHQTDYKQYTDFSMDTIEYQFGSSPFLGTKQTLSIPIKSIPGDLLTNIFLKFQLPSGYSYVSNVGRAILNTVSLYLDSIEIETFDDDWYIIRDDIFLDDDEKKSIKRIVDTDGSMYIPLEFYFSRRNSKFRKEKKQWFPMCAAYKNTMYINIDFQKSEYLTGVEGVDISNVKIVLETITLTDIERSSLLSRPLSVKIQKVYKEPVNTMTNGTVQMNITASFPVSLSVWFLRYSMYETNYLFYKQRYDYGYIKNDIFIYKNEEPFEYMNIYIDGKEITDNFSSTKFFTWLQPILSDLSSPSRSIYMYSFGISPTKGTFDFQKTDSNSCIINMKIKKDFENELTSKYFIHMYHFGYTDLYFSNGMCSRLHI